MVSIIKKNKKCFNHGFFLYFENIVLAATAIANIVRTSLGPLGLDKMLVDDIGVSFLPWEI